MDKPILLHGDFDFDFGVTRNYEASEYDGEHFYNLSFNAYITNVTHWAEITPPEIGETK